MRQFPLRLTILAHGFCIVWLFSSTWLELWTTTHCCDNSHIAWHLRLYKFFIVLLSIYLELFMLTIRRTAGDWPLSSPKMYRPLQKALTPGKNLCPSILEVSFWPTWSNNAAAYDKVFPITDTLPQLSGKTPPNHSGIKKIMILMDWRLINKQCSMFSPDWTQVSFGVW